VVGLLVVGFPIVKYHCPEKTLSERRSNMDENVQEYLASAQMADTSSCRKEAIDKGLGYIHALAFYGLLSDEEAQAQEEKFFSILGEQVDVDIFTNECENKENLLAALTIHLNGGEIVRDIFCHKDGRVTGL
jgi:hypothetical protein